MKGYKATYNFKCLKQTYKVGKTYTADKLKMCTHGFHFCEKMEDVLRYYQFTKEFILLEVEALGKIETNGDKSVTDKLKVIRVVPYDEYTFKDKIPKLEFDERGNMISMEHYDGCITTWRYDSNNNMVSSKGSDLHEYNFTYDPNGHMSSCSNGYGKTWLYEYDDRGNKISETYPNGDKYIMEYDDMNRMVSRITPSGGKYIYQYDERGELVSEINPSGAIVTINEKDIEKTIVTEED